MSLNSPPSVECIDREAKLSHLVLGLGQDHYMRMLFLPPSYSLGMIGINEVSSEHWDKEGEFLKILCRGAARPLGTIDEQALVQRTIFSVGEFQLYDYYTRAIWGLLGDDPRTILSI
jgi:hypothetical protein